MYCEGTYGYEGTRGGLLTMNMQDIVDVVLSL